MDPKRVAKIVIDIKVVTCSICLHIIQDIVQTQCQHNFCRECIERSQQENSLCPDCKQIIFKDLFKTPRDLKNIIGDLKYNCINECGFAATYDGLVLHERECKPELKNNVEPAQPKPNIIQTIGDKDIIYQNCKPKDLINGQTLETIVDIVLTNYGATQQSNDDKEDFEIYCEALSSKLEKPETNNHDGHNIVTSAEQIQAYVKNLLGISGEIFNEQIKEAANPPVKIWGSESFWHIFYRKNIPDKTEFTQFKVIKVFSNGENIQIIPSHLTINIEKQRKRVLFIPWTPKNELNFKLIEKLYVLKKSKIVEFVEEAKNNPEVTQKDK